MTRTDVAPTSELAQWMRAAAQLRNAKLPRRALAPAVLVIYAVSIALLAGLGSAFWAVKDSYPFGTVRANTWVAAPRVGSREVDPYAKAVVARSAEIPLATGEGLMLTATQDEAGRPLDPHCNYRIGTVTPQARYWTVTLYDDAGHPVVSELQRSGFTSAEIMREADGRFAIALSREPMPGNWLRLPERGRPSVVLRLYDTPVAAGSAALDPRTLPVVERLGCAS
ncbi:MAG TPA: DUF1214 domain-containing protein [Beijerinckiaceae bacterium]|nr:DUF1214 domain-containing protein [Beijerinckiaceae bacterium]